jgi:hypothetical protein
MICVFVNPDCIARVVVTNLTTGCVVPKLEPLIVILPALGAFTNVLVMIGICGIPSEMDVAATTLLIGNTSTTISSRNNENEGTRRIEGSMGFLLTKGTGRTSAVRWAAYLKTTDEVFVRLWVSLDRIFRLQ